MFRSLVMGGTLGSIGLAGLLWVAGCAPMSEPGATSGGRRASDREARAVKPPKGELIAGNMVPEPQAAQPLRVSKTSLRVPIVIQEGRLEIIDKQEVPALRDGQLLAIGTPLEGTEEEIRKSVPPDRLVVEEQKGQKRFFRRLKEGDVVEEKQILAVLDQSLAMDDFDIKKAKEAAAIADAEASAKTRDESEQRVKTAQRLLQAKAISLEDFRGAQLTFDRYFLETVSKEKAIISAKSEVNQAATILEMHLCKSKISGVVKNIYKNRGDSVKNLEPVLMLNNHDRLIIKAVADVQYQPSLSKGTKVVVEPTRPEKYDQVISGHTGEVNCVAVTNDPNKPMVVSGSEDTTVLVSDPVTGREMRVLRHPAAVRGIACTPPGCPNNYLVAGLANGSIRAWDLGKEGNEPMWTSSEADNVKRFVNCVAFSLDGALFASGNDDSSIALWDAATGKQLYRFPQGHKNGVTSLQFLPNSQLISVAKDYSLLLWSVGKQNAEIISSNFDRRSGKVPVLGASSDGKRVLFDQGKQLQILSLPDGRPEAALQNNTGSSDFMGVAQFSPDGKLILAVGGPGQSAQLWRAPSDQSRGHEIRQLVTTSPAYTTCGAFAPNGAFVVTATKDRLVFIWPMPPREEFENTLWAEITLSERALDTGRQVRIWAEMDNRGPKLMPGTTASLVYYPGK
jgi:WD40 repeat protein